jgi:hypothetical protein
MRANFYIDGFNLYYGCVRRTSERWLDIGALCRRMFPNDTINRIRYFTALVKPPPSDPQKRLRQEIYLRALRTIPNLSVYQGRFQMNQVERELVNPLPGQLRSVLVHDPKEKGSDVNLATWLLVDGFRGDYEMAVVFSNDPDLCLPISMVTTELKLPVTVVFPTTKPGRTPSRELLAVASSVRTIYRQSLRACQFPPTLTDAHGVITKPAGW